MNDSATLVARLGDLAARLTRQVGDGWKIARDAADRIAELEAALDRAVELERNECRAKVHAAVLAEREACAVTAEGMSAATNQPYPNGTQGVEHLSHLICERDFAIADAIRARPAP